MGPDAATPSPTHQPSERSLLIVAPKPGLYEYAKRLLARRAHITVVPERRRGERRQGPQVNGDERRRAERRLRPETDDQLRLRGWAMLRLPVSDDVDVSSSR